MRFLLYLVTMLTYRALDDELAWESQYCSRSPVLWPANDDGHLVLLGLNTVNSLDTRACYTLVCVDRSCHPLQWSHRHGIRRRSFGSTSPHIRHQTTHVYAWYVVLDPIMNYPTPLNLFQNPGCTAYTSTGVSQYVQILTRILTSFLFGLGSTVGMSVPHR